MTQKLKHRTLWLARLAPWLVIGGLVLFHAAHNWIWLQENVTWTGWDKARHLAYSLSYTHILSSISLQSIFGAAVHDPVRTPLFPASASIMYRLFGYSEDVATMVNVLYMAIALAATYGIGLRWGRSAAMGGRAPLLGLTAAALLALFPMFYCMSRYFYIEFALTAMVALVVFLLLATDGFKRRGASLLFGLSLGLGMLTKRTFGVFAIGPVLVALLASGVWPELWRRVRQRPRIYPKNAVLALGGGLALATLWYAPNREMVRTFFLGDLLFFAWWLLAALAFYFASLPSAPLANSLAALFLGAGVASTWYLVRVEFVQRVALFGYGIADPRGRSLSLGNINTYLYYLRKLGNEHLSLVMLALLVVVLLFLAAAALRHALRSGSALQALRDAVRGATEAWVVLAWLGGAYAILSFSIYQETRAITPVLPAIALLASAALYKLPWRRLRAALLLLLFGFGLVQFFVVSYETAYRVLTPVSFQLPIWGRSTSVAQGVYIQLPDEGMTDSGYWIQPDIMDRMEEGRQASGHELCSVALLLNSSQINAGSFNYLILTSYPQLRLESLIDRFDQSSPFHRLFGHHYVALKRVNSDISSAQEALIEEILAGSLPLFNQAFELETSYRLPDDDSVYLYRARYLLPPGYPGEYITRLADSLGERTEEGDAILVTPQEALPPFVAQYRGPADVYFASEERTELKAIAAGYRRIFLIVGDGAAGEVQAAAEGWLNENAFRASHEWSDSLQLILYGTGRGEVAAAPNVQVPATIDDGSVRFLGYHLPSGDWHAGDILPLSLFWRSIESPEADYAIFVHLLAADGRLLAQNDSPPGGGTLPTSSWNPRETIVDRRGLLLPGDLAPGRYVLRLGLYLPSSGERLSVQQPGNGASDDGLILGEVLVRGADR
jgi:4-amino-4-deoxy-L-arabinose transferase-like glycosyltransferase